MARGRGDRESRDRRKDPCQRRRYPRLISMTIRISCSCNRTDDQDQDSESTTDQDC
ncbi:hypothetical protein X777_10971 [Ooceraea biroi]|uniref:Uncharacterized protein n=1 Tax=Ooceraea biroi TaxID=2015173 RepID=A0A026W3H0_OOCBI|nr:hypothetical protein X777_10971 [Ooceraea biroi]